MSRLIFCLISFIVLVNSERVRYDNYRVYEVTPITKDEVKFLLKLEETSDSLTFLEDPVFIGKSIHIVVAPHKQPDFLQLLNTKGIRNELKEKNLQSQLDKENELLELRSFDNNDYDWKRYHTLEKTYDWLRSLDEKYPEQVELLVGGKSYEGRDILGVKVSYKNGNKGIFIEGGIHAREWISPATVTYILNQLITSQDPKVRDIAENFDWYFFPHTNPDGYVYTRNKNRLWRKTRSPHGLCYGVDPNRNWDFHWDEVGTSSSPCTEIYSGPKAFSEIETKSLSEFIQTLKGKLHTYLAFHSYSQILLFPYGHTKEHAVNHKDLQEIGDFAAEALEKRYGTQYIVGNIYETIYPASGASVDWAYGVADIPLTYGYELRPNRNAWNGFVLPTEQIIPTGEETLDSIVALIEKAKTLGYYDDNEN